MSPVACGSCADQHPTPVDPSLPSSTPELPATWPTTLVSSSKTEEQRESGTGESTTRTLYSILKRPWRWGEVAQSGAQCPEYVDFAAQSQGVVLRGPGPGGRPAWGDGGWQQETEGVFLTAGWAGLSAG